MRLAWSLIFGVLRWCSLGFSKPQALSALVTGALQDHPSAWAPIPGAWRCLEGKIEGKLLVASFLHSTYSRSFPASGTCPWEVSRVSEKFPLHHPGASP